MVTKTVGVGGDYSDWNAVFNWLSTLVFADNYEIIQISDVTNVTVPTPWPAGHGPILSTYTLTFKVSPEGYHNGDPTAGYKTYLPTPWINNVFGTANGDTVIFDGLNIINQIGYPPIRCWDSNGTASNFCQVIIKNCIIQGVGGNWLSFDFGVLLYSNKGSSKNQMYNCKIYNCGCAGIGLTGWAHAVESGSTIENCTVYNCGNYNSGGPLHYHGIGSWLYSMKNISFSNVVSCNNNAVYRDWEDTIPLLSGNSITNCADSDNSIPFGTNNLNNIIPANEFVSLSDTNSRFLNFDLGTLISVAVTNPDKGPEPLKVKFTSNANYTWPSNHLYSSGIAPTLTTTDIAEKIYGQYGNYPIGCHNAEMAY